MSIQKFAVGQAVRRVEDERFMTGTGQYVDDIRLPNTVHAAFVRSPFAHAKIGKIDTAAAKAMPGVLKVLTGKDVQKAGLGPFPTVTAIDGLDENGVAVPDRFADEISLCGPRERIREKLKDWENSPVTSLLIHGDIDLLRAMAELAL